MRKILLIILLPFLVGCSAVKNAVEHQYQLTAFSAKKIDRSSSATILVTQTEAISGYQTEEMRYSLKPYALNSFAKNTWFSPPASMIYPLLIQSLQQSGYFHAVSSGVYVSNTQYRLDTQLLKLQQNFVTRPSVLELKLKAVLTRVGDNQILASKTFGQNIRCPQETPYGGVLAANQATLNLTRDLTHFVIHQIKSDHRNL